MFTANYWQLSPNNPYGRYHFNKERWLRLEKAGWSVRWENSAEGERRGGALSATKYFVDSITDDEVKDEVEILTGLDAYDFDGEPDFNIWDLGSVQIYTEISFGEFGNPSPAPASPA